MVISLTYDFRQDNNIRDNNTEKLFKCVHGLSGYVDTVSSINIYYGWSCVRNVPYTLLYLVKLNKPTRHSEFNLAKYNNVYAY